MAGPFPCQVGAVLSADIAVPDHAREVHFYTRVLSTGDPSPWREDLMNNLGLPIIGLGERTPETEHLPVQWMPHIQVADVAASARRAMELGGREEMHHRDENGASQWAVLADPNGAVFGVIPVVPPEAMPAEALEASTDGRAPLGRIAWVDLTVADAPSTRDFYREVVDWSVEELEMKDGAARYSDYTMLGKDGAPLAGVCHARGPNAGLPPVWLLYLPVGDLAESLERVKAEGGETIHVRNGVDGAPVYAVIRDPAGAHVALVPG